MIKIIEISNLKVIFDGSNYQCKILEGEKKDSTAAPVFSVEGLTEQEKYLLKRIAILESTKDSLQLDLTTIRNQLEEVSIENSSINNALLNIVDELNKKNLAFKSENAGLKIELKERKRKEKEGEYS